MSDYRLSDGMLAHYDSLFPDESRRVTRPSTREATARSIHRQESDRNYSQDPEEVYQRIYYSGPFINGIELPKDFAPGGYHPIHLQDELDDGRYRVIHKLGLTDYGVSWLCRDQHIQTPRYVTVNILTAERSELGNEKDTCQYIKDLYRNEPDLDRRFCLPVRDFTSQSANGAHLCLVYPVMGPPVDEAAFISRRRNITSLVDHTGGLDDAGDNVFLGLLHAHDDDYVNYREAGIYDEDDEWDDATDVGSEDEDRDSVDSGLEDMDTADPDTDDGDWHTEIVGPDYSAPGNSHMGWEELVRQHEEKEKEKQDSQFLRAICRDTAEAVALLHRRGLCHGGLTPKSILIEMARLDGKEEDEVLSVLGTPETWPVMRLVDNLPTPNIPNAPQYIVRPVKFDDASLLHPRVRIAEFSTLSDVWTRPFQRREDWKKMSYSAPEVVVDSLCSQSVDLWSLGCLIFRIRTGAPLIGSMDRDIWQWFASASDILQECLPDPWSEHYSPDPGLPWSRENGGTGRTRGDRVVAIRSAVWRRLHRPNFNNGSWPPGLSTPELASLGDLLERLLRFPPHERLSAEDVLEHAWLKMVDV